MNMIALPPVQQRSLFQALIDKGGFDTIKKTSRILDFMSRIWDIDLLPSTDPRFKTMRGDIQQHYINNDDWDEHYMFSEVLGLYSDAEKFQRLIELVPSSEFQDNENLISSLVEIINSYLIPHKQRLVATNQQGVTIYEVKSNVEVDNSIPENTIPFLVDRNSNKQGSHKPPSQYPAFVLAADQWDDFGVKSLFRLFFYQSSEQQRLLIGAVKIIVRSIDQDSPKVTTTEHLETKFVSLSDEFCSLGQDQKYYENIKQAFPDQYRSILWALRDCAVFPFIEDDLKKDYSFGRSLLRDNEAERLLREAKYLIEGVKITNKESFVYHFLPPFSESETLLDVEFDCHSLLPSRLLAIVGKNGVGKTQMMSRFPIDLSHKKQENFEPQLPLFSKVISISTSLYDHCHYPDKSNEFNYEYIGLTIKDGANRRIITNDEIDSKLQASCKLVNAKGRAKSLRNILEEILSEAIIETLFQESNGKYLLNTSALKDVRQKLSSGESTLLYLLTSVVSTLRFDTLLLFDEPETHLHPNAITTLISALYKLLEEFQSYAIVATHSPLVIREIKSRQVRVMERFGDRSLIRKVQQESLGANISALVDEIFGNKDIPKYYRESILRLVKNDFATAEDIYQAIGTDINSLPIGLQIFTKSLYPYT